MGPWGNEHFVAPRCMCIYRQAPHGEDTSSSAPAGAHSTRAANTHTGAFVIKGAPGLRRMQLLRRTAAPAAQRPHARAPPHAPYGACSNSRTDAAPRSPRASTRHNGSTKPRAGCAPVASSGRRPARAMRTATPVPLQRYTSHSARLRTLPPTAAQGMLAAARGGVDGMTQRTGTGDAPHQQGAAVVPPPAAGSNTHSARGQAQSIDLASTGWAYPSACPGKQRFFISWCGAHNPSAYL